MHFEKIKSHKSSDFLFATLAIIITVWLATAALHYIEFERGDWKEFPFIVTVYLLSLIVIAFPLNQRLIIGKRDKNAQDTVHNE